MSAALIITRPEKAAQRFVEQLDADALGGVKIIQSPLMKTVPIGKNVELGDDTGVIFTSRVAVELAPTGKGRVAYCVGEGTAAASTSAGWNVACFADTAEFLISKMITLGPKGAVKHLSGRFVRADIVEALGKAGWSAERHVLYDQELLGLSAQAKQLLSSDTATIVPLFSPRTAAQFALESPTSKNTTVIAFSASVASAIEGQTAARISVLDAPRSELMKASVEKLCREVGLS